MTIGLISAVVAIAIIIFAANVPIINAQQMTNQPTVSQNGTTLFQSTEDSFRLQVPDGWVIQDVNNTGSTLSNESVQGYGILAQLCPQEEQEEEQAALSNVSGRGDTTTSCQGSEGDIIHIVRYPDLDTRLQVPNNITTNNGNLTIDNILSYHMQKLQEVGYRNITIVNSTYTTVNLTNAQTNQTVSIVPAQFVEIQYRTAVSSPNQIREGYFILTATNATNPNPGIIKGYTIFYEGISTVAVPSTVQTLTQLSGGLPDPPAAVRQILDSFELIAAPEVIQDMLAAQSEQAQEEVVTDEPTNPLIVEIISTNTEGGGGEEEEAVAPATFEFEADVGGGTEPYTYSWDFGDDGSTSSEESDEQTVVHTYNEPGTYIVSLTVTDANGRQATDTLQVTIIEPPSLPTTCEGETATIVGTPGNDINIVGTSGRDVITALGGDDRVHALDGNDLVCGGGGNDVIDGGSGNNRLFGDEPDEEGVAGGADRIEGGTANDFIDGGAGNDDLDGSTGNDELHGSMGSDELLGLTGNDQLFGEDNDDVLDGGSDNDQLNGGAGNDVLDGGGDTDNGDGGPNFDRCVRVETITNCEA
jgi:PKD repeat protein